MSFSRALFALSLCVLMLVCSVPCARAGNYEWERTERLLSDEGLRLAEAPEGKRIAYVRVVRDDVFVDEEIWPTWFNLFHWMTRDDVVRRELLLAPGEPFADARAEESMRNLRNMGIFALVRIVAVATEHPDEVGLIVHTRDLWSLRLEQDFNVTTQINSLLLRITERNLFGRQKSVGTDFTLVPKTYTLRQFYVDRRLAGSSLSLAESAGIIFNRDSSQAEGSLLGLSLYRPFFNLAQRHAFSFDASFSTRIARRLLNGDVDSYEKDGLSAQRAWRERAQSLGVSGSLRRGAWTKHTLTGGFSYRELSADPVAETKLPRALTDDFARDVLPRQRREIGPSVSYDVFVPEFKIFENLGTFGQSENVRLGPQLDLGLRVPLEVLGSTRTSCVMAASLGLVMAPGGGLLEGRVSGSARYEGSELIDQLAVVMLRGATPSLGFGRLVARTVLEARRNDTARGLVALGGDNGLRGYLSQALFAYGASRVLGNVELRTLPVEWQAVHVGGVIFADVGSVYERFREMRPVYGVGVGLRLFFPQFNRYPFSFDAGAPTQGPFEVAPSFQAGQIVPMTALEDAVQ